MRRFDLAREVQNGTSVYAGRLAVVLFLFVAPKVKCVGEDDVTEDPSRVVIAEINRGIELKIARDVAGKAECR
jgi:hypothetical protein